MIRSYAEFIEGLVKSVTTSEEFTWAEFGILMKHSVLLVIFLLFSTIGIYYLLYKGPSIVYHLMQAPIYKKLNELAQIRTDNQQPNPSMLLSLEQKLLKNKILFGLFFVIAYIPLLLPVVLMFINVLF